MVDTENCSILSLLLFGRIQLPSKIDLRKLRAKILRNIDHFFLFNFVVGTFFIKEFWDGLKKPAILSSLKWVPYKYREYQRFLSYRPKPVPWEDSRFSVFFPILGVSGEGGCLIIRRGSMDSRLKPSRSEKSGEMKRFVPRTAWKHWMTGVSHGYSYFGKSEFDRKSATSQIELHDFAVLPEMCSVITVSF